MKLEPMAFALASATSMTAVKLVKKFFVKMFLYRKCLFSCGCAADLKGACPKMPCMHLAGKLVTVFVFSFAAAWLLAFLYNKFISKK